jgi:hypothetical protein
MINKTKIGIIKICAYWLNIAFKEDQVNSKNNLGARAILQMAEKFATQDDTVMVLVEGEVVNLFNDVN